MERRRRLFYSEILIFILFTFPGLILGITSYPELYPLAAYDYNIRGPSSWWFFFPNACDEQLFPHQSPVDLSNSTEISRLPPLTKVQLPIPSPRRTLVYNDGVGLTLRPFEAAATNYLVGGPLIPSQYYKLDNVVLHWGGSEHTIQDQNSVMEIQATYYHAGFNFLEEAAANNIGNTIVVLSHLVQLVDNDIPEWTDLLNIAQDLVDPSESILVDSGIEYLIPLPKPISQNYWTYTGSLTRPPCTGNVRWIISEDSLAISKQQSDKLASLNDIFGKKIVSNRRPPQPLNEREVLHHSFLEWRKP